MSESNQIKVGDVVQLKSGGPKMTVASIYGEKEKRARCEWFASRAYSSPFGGAEMLVDHYSSSGDYAVVCLVLSNKQ